MGQLYDIIPIVQEELPDSGVCVIAEGLQICSRDHMSHQELAVELRGPANPQSGGESDPPPGEASPNQKSPSSIRKTDLNHPRVQRLAHSS